MTAEELREIVKQWGGPERFAAVLHVKPRIVYYWLSGRRRIPPRVAAFIAVLQLTKEVV